MKGYPPHKRGGGKHLKTKFYSLTSNIIVLFFSFQSPMVSEDPFHSETPLDHLMLGHNTNNHSNNSSSSNVSTGSSNNSGNSALWSTGLPDEVVHNDKLLTDSNSSHSSSFSVPVSSCQSDSGLPIKSENSFSVGQNNVRMGRAGSDGDSIPDSPMSLTDGRNLFCTLHMQNFTSGNQK